MDQVDPATLGWKPESGSNWMSVAQLLNHLSTACGAGCKGFVCGDWGLPAGVHIEDLSPEQMLPKAEAFPAIESVDEAKKLLEKDETLALEMINRAGEDALRNLEMEAPWMPGKELLLGQWLFQMIQHLDRHKSQLFYYLKLQGKAVTTVDLWGY
jgi:uncharacterized damage-inducible protein DinB